MIFSCFLVLNPMSMLLLFPGNLKNIFRGEKEVDSPCSNRKTISFIPAKIKNI